MCLSDGGFTVQFQALATQQIALHAHEKKSHHVALAKKTNKIKGKSVFDKITTHIGKKCFMD